MVWLAFTRSSFVSLCSCVRMTAPPIYEQFVRWPDSKDLTGDALCKVYRSLCTRLSQVPYAPCSLLVFGTSQHSTVATRSGVRIPAKQKSGLSFKVSFLSRFRSWWWKALQHLSCDPIMRKENAALFSGQKSKASTAGGVDWGPQGKESFCVTTVGGVLRSGQRMYF